MNKFFRKAWAPLDSASYAVASSPNVQKRINKSMVHELTGELRDDEIVEFSGSMAQGFSPAKQKLNPRRHTVPWQLPHSRSSAAGKL